MQFLIDKHSIKPNTNAIIIAMAILFFFLFTLESLQFINLNNCQILIYRIQAYTNYIGTFIRFARQIGLHGTGFHRT